MNSAEWITVAFFAAFLVAGVLVPLDRVKRLKAIGIGVAGILTASLLRFLDPLPTGDVFRDLLPGLLLLMGYWQSGQFFKGGDAKLQASLQRLDERWFPGVLRISSSLGERPVLSRYLEAAYVMCYPVVPLGIGLLYVTDLSHAADQFWRVVLPPTLACYASTTVFQTLPPWLVDGDESVGLGRSKLRSLNVWVLRRASIRANSLPSGHVASSFAIALVLLKGVPIAGVVFLWIAVSIAMSTVILRYHYSIDAVLGAALALMSFALFGVALP